MANDLPSKTRISTESGSPSYIRTQTTVRTMIPVQLIDTEVDHLTSINNRTLIWSSATVGFLTYGADIFFDNIFIDQLTPFQELALKIGVPIFGALALICILLATQAFLERSTLLNKIKNQTTVIGDKTEAAG